MAKEFFFKRINKSVDLSKKKEEDEEEVEKKNQLNNRDTVIMDRSITKYIIDNFSDIVLDIRDSLINFSDTLENTIDYIEDKSSIAIKDSRNFKLSQDYRDKSIEIYEVVEKINDYVSWIDESYDSVKAEENIDYNKENEIIGNKEKEIDEQGDNKICITEDFTSKSPKAFKIDNYYFEVSDWKELTVKAADILTKNYKNNNKHEEISVDEVVLKESIENDFRDSVIDILKIYSVPLNKFYVYVK